MERLQPTETALIFSELRATIVQGEVLVPGDAGYEESLERWSATCIKRAMVVVRPIDASEAAIAVRLATGHRVPFVVRGGGHSPSGSSASSGGMVIDLGLMRGVSTDRAAQLVTFGGGCIWEDVDKALWAEGFATPGGTVSHTGVGGLILGGGYSLLTGRHGLSIDNLVRCEVVLASGVVVTASADENADLFWALRGAGHSFGIVTAFTSRIHAQGMVWGGLVAYPMSALPALVAFANTFAATNDGGQAMLLMLGCHPKTLAPCMATSLFYDGPREDAERFYTPLLGLEKMLDRTGVVPYPVANTFANPKTPPGKRYVFSGASFVCPLEAGMVREASDRFHEMLAREGNGEIKTRSMVGFELTPGQKVKSIPVGDTAFANREGPAYNAIINISWDTEERDAEAKNICATVARFLRDSGWHGNGPGSHGATYLNYLNVAVDEDRVLAQAERVFGPNADRLRRLKMQYDPLNAFEKTVDLMPIGMDGRERD